MIYTDWTICNKEYNEDKKRSRDALFTIGNGYFGVRGFFEEDTEGVDGFGGIYMAGIFGKGNYSAWEGMSRELCNVSNVFRVKIVADGEKVCVGNQVEDFSQLLDMENGRYSRTYIYTTCDKKKIKVSFERFASMHNRHFLGQKVEIESLTSDTEIELSRLIDSNVKNLNLKSCEPFPIQPGRDHIVERKISEDFIITKLDDTDETVLTFAQNLSDTENILEKVQDEYSCGAVERFILKKGEKKTFRKLISVYSSKDEEEFQVKDFLNAELSYEDAFELHKKAWQEKWSISDIKIQGNSDDQTVLRYNIFQLLCVCPEHTDKLSIGARGLSGEMYEGCVFWDNEIFKFPFFVYTNPEAARKLLTFRYHTLEAAKRHAKRNWFEGALYPWQVSEKGIEQTPMNGGAYYAIHITADIAYAIQQYWNVSGDDEFILEYGAEILVEIARFFASRVDYDEDINAYEIRAVRGPNEYDVMVNNNLYTNKMAIESLETAERALLVLENKYSEELQRFLEKHDVTDEERKNWKEIAEHILIPYKEEMNLYLEDDAYLKRRPLDMKKAKPTQKRIIDTTIPYEALPMYQVTKQSDVVLMMNLLPHMFSEEEKRTAYEFYEPKTAHDSSLSYAPYGVMAAALGNKKEAYRYFRQSAYLDIDDRQLNTISGIHFANFGGTWQLAYFGYAGISENDGVLYIDPHLPDEWKSMELTAVFRGSIINIQINEEAICLNLLTRGSVLKTNVGGKEYQMTDENAAIVVER